MRIQTGVAEVVLARIGNSPEWMDEAACAEDDVFPFYQPESERTRSICRKCPVLSDCQEYVSTLARNGRALNLGVFAGIDNSMEGGE